MASRLNEAGVAKVKIANRNVTNHPDIVFTKQDAEGLHFLQGDALIVKLTISRCFAKRILIDTGSSVDIIFLSALRHMKFEKGN